MKHSENIKDLTLSQIIKLKSEKNIPDLCSNSIR